MAIVVILGKDRGVPFSDLKCGIQFYSIFPYSPATRLALTAPKHVSLPHLPQFANFRLERHREPIVWPSVEWDVGLFRGGDGDIEWRVELRPANSLRGRANYLARYLHYLMTRILPFGTLVAGRSLAVNP